MVILDGGGRVAVVGDGLFKLALWVSVMVEGRLSVGMGWHVRVSLVVVGLLI